MEAPDTQSSMMAPLGAQSHLPLPNKNIPVTSKKQETPLNPPPFPSKNSRKTKCHPDDQKDEQRVQDDESDDSSYEYSADIMGNNPKNQTRKQKEKGRLSILMTFDWMRETIETLKLTRQVLYRGVIILRKFLLLEKKNPRSHITVANIRLYALAALLISNKLDNINGNFLAGKAFINTGDNGIQKQRVTQCEKTILRTLKFSVEIKSLITENLIKIIQNWNSFVKDLKSSNTLQFDFNEIISSNNSETQKLSSLEVYLHLADFVLLRKITGLSLKELQKIDDSFYQPLLLNTLFHLSYFQLRQTKQGNHRKFSQIFIQFVFSLNPNSSKGNLCCRPSHNVLKQIKQLYSLFNSEPNSPVKFRELGEVTNQEKEEGQVLVVKNETQFISQKKDTQVTEKKEINQEKKKNVKENSARKVPPIYESQAYLIRKIIDSRRYLPIVLGKLKKIKVQTISNLEYK